MAFDGSDNCWRPDFPTLGATRKWRQTITNYGDGYQQRLLDGINALDMSWTVIFENRPEDVIDAMTAYFESEKGSAFSFFEPTSQQTYAVFCNKWHIDWTIDRHTGTYGTLTAEFVRANGSSLGEYVVPAPLALTSWSLVPSALNLGGARFSITARLDGYLANVAIYRVPPGATLDKNTHERRVYPAYSGMTFETVFGDPGVPSMVANYEFSNVAPPPSLGRMWNVGTFMSDTFDRANANLEASAVASGGSGGWSWTHDGLIAGGAIIATNQLKSNTLDTFGSAYKTPDVGSADHFVQFTVQSTTNAAFVACRLADNKNYIGVRHTSATLEVFQCIAGSFLQLWNNGIPAVVGNSIRLECSGTVWTVYLNGVSVGTGTIPASLTSSGTGFVARNSTTGIIDIFSAGTLTGKMSHGVDFNNKVAYSDDGINWEQVTPAFPDVAHQWEGIAWSPELGLFCAVAAAGGSPTTQRAMTSPDGINWTIRASATATWRDICWGGPSAAKLFVVCASGSTSGFITSPNGINWTVRAKPVNNQMRSVCWGEPQGKFVAVGDTGTVTGDRVMTSPDGITWTQGATGNGFPESGWWWVTWAGDPVNLFVALANSGTGGRVATSPDGITWTQRTTANDVANWTCVCWSADKKLLCAVAASGGSGLRCQTSPDGINWTTQNIPSTSFHGVIWAPDPINLFVAMGTTGGAGTVVTSPDGIVWTVRNNIAQNLAWLAADWSPTLKRLAMVTNTVAVSPDPFWWKGAPAMIGNKVRGAVTIESIAGGAGVSFIAGNPDREVFPVTPYTAPGSYTLNYALTKDASWLGLQAPTDTATQIDNAAIFVETLDCAPQGQWDFYIFPVNSQGTEGLGLPAITGVNIV